MLQYYKLTKTSEGSIALESGPRLPNIKGGVGIKDKKKDPRSVIIDKMNEKFGTQFTEKDKVLN